MGLGAAAGVYASDGVKVNGAGVFDILTSSALVHNEIISPSFNLSARTQLGANKLAMLNIYGDGPSFNVSDGSNNGDIKSMPFNIGANIKFGTVAKKVGTLAIVPLGGVAVDYISQYGTIGSNVYTIGNGNRIATNSLSITGMAGAQFLITPNKGKQQLTIETTVGAGVQLGNISDLEKNGQFNAALTAGFGLEHRFNIGKSAYVGYGIKSDVNVFIAPAKEMADNAARNTLAASADAVNRGF